MHSFTYEFEELPLAIVMGIPAALTEGSAEIQYSGDGDWLIVFSSICVQGYQSTSIEQRAAGKSPWVYVPAPTDLKRIIIGRLYNEHSDRVSSAVSDQLDKDHASDADTRADILHARRVGAA